MLFTVVKQLTVPEVSSSSLPDVVKELQQKASHTKPVAAVKPWAVMWVTCLIVFFVLVAIYAHQINYDDLATAMVNLAVATTSGSVGAIMGERSAVKDLTK